MDNLEASASIANNASEDQPPVKRPFGISFFAIVDFLSGIGILVLQFMYGGVLSSGADEFGVSSIALNFSLAVFGLVGIVAGIGMWLGKT